MNPLYRAELRAIGQRLGMPDDSDYRLRPPAMTPDQRVQLAELSCSVQDEFVTMVHEHGV